MNTEASDQVEAEIKRLERDKQIEEIKQLKASRRIRWITPAALAALLPLLAGFGLWVVEEMKQYNEGYRALQELGKLTLEKEELRKQKDSLNIELGTLLNLKNHYAGQVRDLQARFEERQKQFDTTYVRARFASTETRYALGHIEGYGPAPDTETLKKKLNEPGGLPSEVAEQLRELIARYELATDMIDISQRTLAAFDDTLDLIPASDWAVQLKYTPSSSVVPNRNIMLWEKRDGVQLYDVDEGRFLSEDEVPVRAKM